MQTLLEKSGVLSSIFSSFFDKAKGEIMDEVKPGGKQSDASYLKGSISEYTKNLIMTFPVMCDNSLPSETASMISRANERNIIAMLQMLFASVNLKGSDGVAMLSQIHKNFSVNMAADEFIDSMNALADKMATKYESVDELLAQPKVRQAIREMTYALKTPQKSFPVSSFSESSLNDYLVRDIYGKTVVMEARGKSSSAADAAQQTSDQISNAGKTADEQKKAKTAAAVASANREESKKGNASNIKANDVKALQANIDFNKKMLLDQDVKKFNELTPSLLIVKFNNSDKTGAMDTTDTFIAGVKSRLISVDSVDIAERLIAKNKTKLSFLNLIRATTGEISFINDFILCTKQAKIDAKNAVKKGPAAKMWSALEYRATKNNMNKLKKAGNDASAITTLVINQETVNLLKKEYGFDLERMSNTKLIIDSYNLLGIVICDESINVAKVFYVGNDTYETQAYSFLEKEKSDKGYKEIINLLNTRR